MTLRLVLMLVFVLRYYSFTEAPPAEMFTALASSLDAPPTSTSLPSPLPPTLTTAVATPAFPDLYHRHILEAAYLYQIHPDLIRAVIQAESAGDPRALSHKGAQGLMQLMPATASWLRLSDPFDPRQNILGGTCYLRFLLDTFHGDVALALSAYNAGEAAVLRHRGVPPYHETRQYLSRVARVLSTPQAD